MVRQASRPQNRIEFSTWANVISLFAKARCTTALSRSAPR